MSVTPHQFGMQVGQQAKQANIGTALRGLGIQAGRAGLRLGNAAKPLVDEATSMANTGAQRLGQTMFGNPVRAAVSGAGLATAGGVYGDHLAAKNQAMSQLKDVNNDVQKFNLNGVGGVKTAFGIYGAMGDAMAQARGQKTMNPIQAGMMRRINPSVGKHIGADGVFRNPQTPATPALAPNPGMPNLAGTGQGGLAGSSDPYSANLSQAKLASLLSALGGGLGAGVGGLAGGMGGGMMGGLLGTTIRPVSPALTGLGLLAGGAAGMGAGAYMGGNIGSDIGRSFSKKKESPESAEKEESAEKDEDKDAGKDKEAALVLPAAGIGAGLGAVTSPSGHRMEGAARGAAKGTGAGFGAAIGAPIGALGTVALALMNPRIGKKMFGPSGKQLKSFTDQLLARSGIGRGATRPRYISPENRLRLGNTILAGGVGGGVGGGALGYAGADALLGKPTWETNKQANSFSALVNSPAVKKMLQGSAAKLTHAVKTTGANPGVVLPAKPLMPAASAPAVLAQLQKNAATVLAQLQKNA